MQPLKINKYDLEMVFEDSYEHDPAFLDGETGRVILAGDHMDMMTVDSLCEADTSLTEVVGPVYEAMIEEKVTFSDLRSTVQDELYERSRYQYIEPQDSNEGYRDMILFARSAEDDDLRQALLIALDGRGAFRRFKDVLLGYPEQRDEWFAFKEERLTQRMRDWCESIGVDAIFV